MGAPLPPDPPPASRWRGRRWILVSAAVVALVLGAFWWLAGDEPPPDVSDLVFVPRALRDEENAFVVLTAAAAKVDATPWARDEELFFEMKRGQSWDTAKAAQWLAANESLWSEIERGAKLPGSQGPAIKTLGDLTPDIGGLRRMFELMLLRAWSFQREGRRAEAVAWLGTCLQAAQRIEDSRSTLITWLAGLAFHGMTCKAIEDMARERAFDRAETRALVQALEQTRVGPAGLADALRNERNMFTIALGHVQDKGLPAGLDDNEFERLFSVSRRFSFLLKPNRTNRLNAEHVRRTIALIDTDAATIKAAIPEADAWVGKGWRKWNPDNAAGRVLLAIVTPTLHSLLSKRLRGESVISATQAFVALRCCEAERGRLPEKLDALVPDYLPHVPRDFFDRQPLRYSREFRALWAVGMDGLAVTAADQEVEPHEVYLRLPPPAAAP